MSSFAPTQPTNRPVRPPPGLPPRVLSHTPAGDSEPTGAAPIRSIHPAASTAAWPRMQKDQLIEFARRYTSAWCSREAERVAAFYSTDGSLSVNAGTPAVGRGAITEVAQSFMSAFPDLRVVMDGVLAQGHRIE